MSLKVWQVDPAHLTPYYDAALCTALARLGCSVRHLTSPFLYDPALPSPMNYQRDYLYFRRLNYPRLLDYPRLRHALRIASYVLGHRQLIRKLDADPPDIVHFQWSRMPRLDRWLIEQIRQRDIPVIHTVHDIEPLFPIANLANTYAGTDQLIVHTESSRNGLVKLYPHVPKHKVHVIAHIAVEWEIPPQANRTHARRSLGIPLSAPVLLFFGSIRNYKNLEMLLHAYMEARKVCPELWIVIAGRLENKHLLPHLKQLDKQSVVKLTYIPSDEVWLYHLAADIAIFPYRQISQSGAVLTAMVFGLPVIVTDVGGMRETVDGNGWFVPPNDPFALMEVLMEAVNSPLRLQEMGKRSKRLMCEQYSPEVVARQTMAVYEEALAAHSLYYR